MIFIFFFFSSRRRHTRLTCDWSSDVCSSDLMLRTPLFLLIITASASGIDLKNAVIVSAPGLASPEKKAALMLSDEIEIGRASCRERGWGLVGGGGLNGSESAVRWCRLDRKNG